MAEEAPSGLKSTAGSMGELSDRQGQVGINSGDGVQVVSGQANLGGASDRGSDGSTPGAGTMPK